MMLQKQKVQQRHAEFYLNKLRSITEQFNSQDSDRPRLVNEFDMAWLQVLHGHEWALNADSEDALALLDAYPLVASALLEIRIAPAQLIAWFEAGLDAAGRLNNRKGEMEHLGQLGITHENMGHYEQALDYAYQALAISQELGDREAETRWLGNIGLVYRRQHQYSRAVEYFQQSGRLAMEINDIGHAVSQLTHLSGVHLLLNELDPAEQHALKALEITKGSKRPGEVDLYINLGSICVKQNRIDEAENYYREALALALELNHSRSKGLALSGLARVALEKHNTAEAIRLRQEAIQVAQSIGDPNTVVGNLSEIVRLHLRANEYEAAVEIGLKALATARASEERYLTSTVLGDLGLGYLELGQAAQAVKAMEECVQIRRSLNINEDTVYLSLLGVAYNLDGAYQKGIETLIDAAQQDSQAQRPKEQAINLAEAGRAYLAMGQIDKARDMFTQAKALQATLPPDFVVGLDKDFLVADRVAQEGAYSPDKQHHMLGMLGAFYLEQGASEVALRFFHRALHLSIVARDQSGELFQYSNLGAACQSLSRYEEAIKYLDKAVALARDTKDQMTEAVALNTMGIAYRHLSQWDMAIQQYRRAAELARALGKQDFLAQVQKNLEMAQQKQSSLGSDEGNELNQIFNRGLEHLGRRNYDQAVRDFEQVIPLSRAAGNRTIEGGAHNNIAVAYQLMGNFQKSAIAYEQALALQDPQDKTAIMNSRHLIGGAYLNAGQYRNALEHFEKGLALAQELKNVDVQLKILLKLGLSHADLGQVDRGLEYLNSGLQLARQSKQFAHEGILLMSIGKLQLNAERYAEAQDALKKARKIFQAPGAQALLSETDQLLRQVQQKMPSGFRWPWQR